MISQMKRLFLDKSPYWIKKSGISIFRSCRLFLFSIQTKMFSKQLLYYCPCCGMRFNSFVSGHYLETPQRFNPQKYRNYRQNVICPVCKSLPRHRILASWCEDNKDKLLDSNVLYFAPEYCMSLWMKKQGIRYVTADLYNEADLCLDIQSTGLTDNSIDIIICNHVLEHVDDFRTALKELFRILKHNGILICSFPMDKNIEYLDEETSLITDKERYERFGQNDHKRVFGKRSDLFLCEAGFDVAVISGDNYPSNILPVVGPADYDINLLFCCRKK